MGDQTIPVVDLDHLGTREGDDIVGRALEEVGFFSVENHQVPVQLIEASYTQLERFFSRDLDEKMRYLDPSTRGQRGYTPVGQEHARDSTAPDLKEFFMMGRPGATRYYTNIWPDHADEFRTVFIALYEALDDLGQHLLQACARYLGEDPDLLPEMVRSSDTVLRLIHYPPITDTAPSGSVRSAAHEDINLITLLPGSTAEGLELLQRDGSWLPIRAGHQQIIVDSGDMLQNLTNGVFRSTTHRVTLPRDPSRARYAMPFFIHPRKEIDLAPLDGCVHRRGETEFPAITAGAYLEERLREIGLA